MATASRREFLGSVGQGMLIASLGSSLVGSLCAATLDTPATGSDGSAAPPMPGDLEALVRLMQETAPTKLMPELVRELRAGTKLETLVSAGALANARTFGGEDYEGYHAFMALLPAYYMAAAMPEKLRALPVLKVLYRNTARIQRAGGGREILQPVEAAADAGAATGAVLRARMQNRDMQGAERAFAGICRGEAQSAFEDLRPLVHDDLNVHRIVLAWRSWDMLNLVGTERAHTMLRQCVRFCVDEERTRVEKGQSTPAIRDALPRILDRHKLPGRELGDRKPEDAWVEELAGLVFQQDREGAADAVAGAVAEGFSPEAIGEAISLAGNRLLLHDTGKRRVHGASVGVHASDAANAWRQVARIGPGSSRVASLIVGAYHTAGQTEHVGREPYAFDEQLAELDKRLEDEGGPVEAAGDALLRAAQDAIESNDQRAACAAVHRYGQLELPPARAFEVLLRYAVSEDGALHAEKYYHTAHEEFAAARPAFRWRHLVGLARVTASQHGERAPGYDQARGLLEA